MKSRDMNKKGVLLINLGTPDDCDNKSVYRYLKEFLNDPRVIDLPFLFRWFFVNCFILPLRYKKTAKAYQKIWHQGSPLLIHTQQLGAALSLELGNEYQVEIGMRYGNPSLQAALSKLKHVSSLVVLPLFPQFASASSGSAIEKLLSIISNQWNIPHLLVQKEFYDHPEFIAAYAEVIANKLQTKPVDCIVFSYHGLPERHINKSLCKAACTRVASCPPIDDANHYCYRAQCHMTTQLIANQLGLAPHQYVVAFQSRLGRTPWIKPYTDLLLPQLLQKGIKNIAIVSPSFVSDCLETLEEIDIRTRATWQALGGNDFIFIPCLNNSDRFVKALATMAIY